MKKSLLLLSVITLGLTLSACTTGPAATPAPQPVPVGCKNISTDHLEIIVEAHQATVNVKSYPEGQFGLTYNWTADYYTDADGQRRPLNGLLISNNVTTSGRVLPAGCADGLKVWEQGTPEPA